MLGINDTKVFADILKDKANHDKKNYYKRKYIGYYEGNDIVAIVTPYNILIFNQSCYYLNNSKLFENMDRGRSGIIKGMIDSCQNYDMIELDRAGEVPDGSHTITLLKSNDNDTVKINKDFLKFIDFNDCISFATPKIGAPVYVYNASNTCISIIMPIKNKSIGG